MVEFEILHRKANFSKVDACADVFYAVVYRYYICPTQNYACVHTTFTFLELQINLNFTPGQKLVNSEWDPNYKAPKPSTTEDLLEI
jgi:hypothetical protein